MAAVTSEPIREGLKAMQACPGNLEEGQPERRGEVRALRTTVHGARADLHSLHETFSALDGRMARIGCRLDIIDVPAS